MQHPLGLGHHLRLCYPQGSRCCGHGEVVYLDTVELVDINLDGVEQVADYGHCFILQLPERKVSFGEEVAAAACGIEKLERGEFVLVFTGFLDALLLDRFSNDCLQLFLEFIRDSFASKLYSYSLQWRGEYGWFSNIWQFSAIEKRKGSFEPVVSLGQKATIGDFAIGFDWINRLGDWDLILIKGNAFTLRGEYDDSNDWKVTATAIYETCASFRSVKAGAIVEYFPLPEGRRDLRLAFSAAYNTHLKTLTTSLGCTYILNHNFKRK